MCEKQIYVNATKFAEAYVAALKIISPRRPNTADDHRAALEAARQEFGRGFAWNTTSSSTNG